MAAGPPASPLVTIIVGLVLRCVKAKLNGDSVGSELRLGLSESRFQELSGSGYVRRGIRGASGMHTAGGATEAPHGIIEGKSEGVGLIGEIDISWRASACPGSSRVTRR